MSKDGKNFAVKRMPTRWVRLNPKDFTTQYPTAIEHPWEDMGLVRLLNKLEFPFVSDLLGLFHSPHEMFVVSTFCTGRRGPEYARPGSV